MAWFRRNKDTKQTVLPELERYYDAERRERSGLAWLLAIVSIACVALILIGLFFGSRWVYRKVTTDKKPAATTTQTSKNTTKKNAADDGVTNSTAKPTPAAPSTPAPTTATKPAPAVVTPAAPAPAAPQAGKLTNTGPGSTALYFVIATAIGTLGYRLKLLKRSEA